MNKLLMLDGAMGTMLQSAGLPLGHAPELFNIEHPEIITEIGRKYVAAGSDIIYANTFGANRLKLKGANVSEVIAAGVAAAKKATEGRNCRVALDIGPIGQLLEPLGTLSFDEAYDIFLEMITAGEKAGADLIVFETMSDLYEVKAGVLAAKENSKLPVYVTMTFEENARTFVGVTVPAMALTLEGLGADAIGFNCSLGPKELLPMVKELCEWCSLPIILKPNAGLPDPSTGLYDITPEQFASELCEAAKLGVTIFGGCCGTTPEFIAAAKAALDAAEFSARPKKLHSGVCSATKHVAFDGVRIIGERINPTGKKRFAEALRNNEIGYILTQGIEQQDAGADILDVNVGLPEIDEPEMMKTVIKKLQSVTDLPLQIDSSDIAAIETGLRYYNGKPIVNSVNGDEEKLKKILPLCKKYGAAVIGLTMDEGGIPHTADERVLIAKRIASAAKRHGIDKSDVIIDCLTLTVSAQQEQALETVNAVRRVTNELHLSTTLGVSNISFGLPQREKITASFLTACLASGLKLPIINPNATAIMDAVATFKVLSGEDKDSTEFIARFSNRDTVPKAAEDKDITLESAILRGLGEQTAKLTQAALKSTDAMSVVNSMLIPALDKVGDKYERGELYLPQLINAANAACEGFEVIKAAIAKKGAMTISMGKIIVATVKGDIHDIGKNIVKVVLENYGYTVIDLGRDVAPEKIVECAIKENIKLIGLSALMTTTVVSMEQTIRALRESGHECTVFVGGAVLTEEYAAKIGADYYARDAKQSVDIAKVVLS